MCDSISFIAFIDEGIATEVYDQCAFPPRTKSDAVPISANFRIEYCTSPLTGAQFRVTPIGMLVNMSLDDGDTAVDRVTRFQYGRVAGYLFEGNIPATVIGHNRLLVNGVRAAIRAGLGLLKFWLVQNGCTRQGIDRIRLKDVVITDLTLTYLYQRDSIAEARGDLHDFRTYTEAVLNKPVAAAAKDKKKRKAAFSIPKDPVGPVAEKTDRTFTSYVKQREFLLSVYVKERDQPNAFVLPLDDPRCEARLNRQSLRTLRVEVRVHAKWLKDNGLHMFDSWQDNCGAYEKVFNLLRDTLRLDDDGMRTKRLKKTSVDRLKLNAGDQAYLTLHLEGISIRQHADFLAMPIIKRSSRYYDLRKRIFDATDGIDLDLPYAVQSRLFKSLSELLLFPGEFDPGEDFAGFVFSRVSVPLAIKELESMTNEVLESDSACVFKRPQYTVYRGPDRDKDTRMTGIGRAPLPAEDCNED